MEAIIFIGIQGSGKSTFYQQHFFHSHLRLSLDMLKTRPRQQALIQACLAARQRFVIDNTNVGRQERADYIAQAHAGGFKVTGYFFVPQVERALQWNAQRSGKALIPVKGVLGTLKRLEQPQLREGFDTLYHVDVDDQGHLVPVPVSA